MTKFANSAGQNRPWSEERYRRILLDNHIPDWDSRFLKNYDAKTIARRIVDSHVNVALISYKGLWGDSYYDTKIGHSHSGMGNHDQARELTDELHRYDVKVIGYLCMAWDNRAFREHPDWQPKRSDGTPIIPERPYEPKYICLNSPAREYLLSHLQEIVDNYDVDGIFLDHAALAQYSTPAPCYCDYCRRAFREISDTDIPTTIDWTDPDWIGHVKWRYDVIDGFLKECKVIVKKAKPEAVFYYNFVADIFNSWVRGQSIRSGKIADYIAHDAYAAAVGFLGISLESRLFASVSRNQTFEFHMERTIGHSSDYEVKPLDQLKAEAFTVIANGGAPLLFDILHPDGTIRPEVWDAFGAVFAEVRKREEWLLDAERLKFVAVVYSESSRDFSQLEGQERYSEHVGDLCGICMSLLESHIPFAIISDLRDASIGDYQLLVLPNTLALSEEELAIIRKYVEDGGRLIATFESSLKDVNDMRGTDFGLQDVFGIHYDGLFEYSENYMAPMKDHPISHQISRLPLFHNGPQVKIGVEKDTAVLGKLVGPYIELESTGEKYSGICNGPSDKAMLPAIVCSKYGQGETIYFTGRIGEMCLRIPRYKLLIRNAVEFLVDFALPIRIDAPPCIEITLFEQVDKKRLIVHFVNFQSEV